MDAPSSDQASGKVHVSSDPGRASADFRALFDAHYAYVCASLRRLGVSEGDREDAAIEVFCRVHARLDTYDDRRPVKPWLFAFAARVASEYRRRERRRPHLANAGETEPAAAPASDRFAEREARRLVLAALASLDDDKRTVLVLHDLDECTVPDIAIALGVPEGTVYTRLRAARARFSDAVRRLRAQEKTR
jgi:RNA polymerase sigma-70 factor (ECF subfamily)